MARAVKSERGYTLLEILVTFALLLIVMLGIGSLYLATARSFRESDSQAMLQRQGTLALGEIARQVRNATGATPLSSGCSGLNSLQVTTAATTYCYYVGAAGQLCEAVGATCRNILAGAPKKVTASSLTLTPSDPKSVFVAFTISDGINAMDFSSSVTCVGRNC